MKLFTALSILAASSSPLVAQEAYPLTCKFGADTSIAVAPSLTQPRTNKIYFSFRRATKPATMGVEPGTCAWQDRALFETEPTTVMQIEPAATIYSVVDGKAFVYPANAPWVQRAIIEPGYQVTFNVYQTTAEEPVPYFRVK